ncbi:MAG: YihY/virulence factor BrkB family protein, partial [Bacteroidales bacterium]|nr:YihY/virulence factor BrkB family protein [Bacteroidales bacterium]
MVSHQYPADPGHHEIRDEPHQGDRNGVFGWISFLSFVWTIVWLMINVEIAFNRIWQVDTPRKLWQRVAVYFAIMLVTPFVLV